MATEEKAATNKFKVFDLRTSGGPKGIFEAAECGDVAYVNNYIENSLEFDADMMDALQRTGLHWAAEMGHHEVATIFLESGCNVTAEECNGRTAVHLAARSGDTKMLHILIETIPVEERASAVNKADIHGITPVFLAVQKMETSSAPFEFLMSNGGKFSEDISYQAARLMEKAATAAERRNSYEDFDAVALAKGS